MCLTTLYILSVEIVVQLIISDQEMSSEKKRLSIYLPITSPKEGIPMLGCTSTHRDAK